MRTGAMESLAVRLFANRSSVRYRGHVHEYLELTGKIGTDRDIVFENIPNKLGKEGSAERTIRLQTIDLAKNPQNLRALWHLGNAYNMLGRLDEAIASYDRYVQLGGRERVTAARLITECLLAKHDWDRAIDAGLRALRLDPRYAETHRLIGDAYLAQEDYAVAMQWYRSALACGRPPPEASMFIMRNEYGPKPRDRLRQCRALLRRKVS
jgi:tetratricopeptide (TPR) repeat protein